MLDHSAGSILPFLLTFFCYLIVLLPLLLIWLPELLGRRARDGQEASLPDGATEAPYCPACQAEKGQIECEHQAPPPQIEPQRGRPHEVDTRNHYCPNRDCPYFGWVDWGNIRSNGHPNGGRWRQLECVVCQRYFMETPVRFSSANQHRRKLSGVRSKHWRKDWACGPQHGCSRLIQTRSKTGYGRPPNICKPFPATCFTTCS